MSKKKKITIIAAVSENNVLGKNNKLIWHIPDDLKRFKKLTIGHSVVMGRKTFESMDKPLPERKNIILTRNKNYKAKGTLIAHNVQEALNYCENDNQPFIIGGGEIYNLFLDISDKIELTRIHKLYNGDAFFPEILEKKWRLINSKKNNFNNDKSLEFSYLTYIKK
jgi:dihydrofolate reductase